MLRCNFEFFGPKNAVYEFWSTTLTSIQCDVSKIKERLFLSAFLAARGKMRFVR